jgi:hypothetical protein
MSTGYTGSDTRGLSDLDHEIEYRLGSIKEPPRNRLQDKLKHMDIFTDEFSPPGAREAAPGANFHKPERPYADSHADQPAAAEPGFVRAAAAGRADDQKEYDSLDEAVAKYDKAIKDWEDQFPGSTMYNAGTLLHRMAEGVDEGLWKKAKDASHQAFGKIKWPFVQWWYQEHGGK